MSTDQDESSEEIPDDPSAKDDGQDNTVNKSEGNDCGITAKQAEEEQQQQSRMQEDSQLEVPLLALDNASEQSKEGGHNYFSEAPPPSPEKTRRERPTRRITRSHADTRALTSEDLSRRSGLELEVEELLDNSSQWRKALQARIRTPVRRAVLSYGGVSPGRRQQVLCDLNAKVRELDVASLSRGIACSLRATGGQLQQPRYKQQPGGGQEDSSPAADGIGAANKLDPRHMKQSEELSPSKHDSLLSWHNAGRPQLRGHSIRSRAATVHSRDADANARATGTVAGSGSRPLHRFKTSLTTLTAPLAGSSCWSNGVTKADLLRLQTINGEVQRSLYTERTPGLRRLLHAGGGDSSVDDLCGSSLQTLPLARLLTGGREKSSAAGLPARRLQQRV